MARVAVCTGEYHNVVKLESVFDNLSGPAAVDRELRLGRVQGVEKRVCSRCHDVAVEDRASDLLTLTVVNLDGGLGTLRKGRNRHD